MGGRDLHRVPRPGRGGSHLISPVPSPSPQPRRIQSHQRRRQILDAALDAFLEVGETGTFITEVCRRAGASVGAVYHHFGSKDQLIATLHFDLLDRYQSGAGPILAADPPAEVGIRDTVAYHVAWLTEHPREATFLLQQPFAGYRSDQVPAELLEANVEFLATARHWMHARMDEGTVRRVPFDVVVALLIGPVHHWVRTELYRDPSRARERASSVSQVLADGAWRALRA